MPSSTPQKASVTTIGLVVTLLALIGLLAVILVRSRAESTSPINQETTSSPVAMTLTSQTLTQTNADVAGINNAAPANKVHLTSGSLSDTIQLDATLVNTNGVNTVLMGRPGASLHVLAVYGSVQQTSSCTTLGLDGTSCWEMNVTGDHFSDNQTVQPQSTDPSETHASIHVPIRLPHFAKDGAWTIYWKLIPTDSSGTANPSFALQNNGVNILRMIIDQLVAIDVHIGSSGVTAAYFGAGNATLKPGDISVATPIHVEQKGNVQDQVGVYGTNWSCDNGQAMDVGITHFLGTSLASYTAPKYQILASGGSDAAIRIADSGDSDWLVPTSSGTQDDTVTTLGTNAYDTMIQVASGISGTCNATMTNLARVYTPTFGTHPSIVGTTAAGSGMNVPEFTAYANGYAYVANLNANTVSVINVSTPSAPTVTQTITGLSSPYAIAISGDYAYVNNWGNNTISVVNISNPGSDSIVATITGLSGPQFITISGTHAYVSSYLGNRIDVIDISNPLTASISGSVSGNGLNHPKGVSVSGNTLTVSNYGGPNIKTYDISNPNQPVALGTLTGITSVDLESSGNYAYVTNNAGGHNLKVIDLSNPSQPTVVGTASIGLGMQITSIQGSYVFATGYVDGALWIFDVSTPTNPTVVGTVTGFTGAYGVAVSGNYAYIANSASNSMSVVKLTN
jgi:YVTN family beta-propeller protein